MALAGDDFRGDPFGDLLPAGMHLADKGGKGAARPSSAPPFVRVAPLWQDRAYVERHRLRLDDYARSVMERRADEWGPISRVASFRPVNQVMSGLRKCPSVPTLMPSYKRSLAVHLDKSHHTHSEHKYEAGTDGQRRGIDFSMNLDHFYQLMDAFQEADTDGSGGLDIDEFREAFGSILGRNLNKDQMTMLFMKIDANSDGTVDWDEFCTYMLLEKKGELEMMEGDTRTIFHVNNRFRVDSMPSKDVIRKVLFVQKDRKYISVARDGVVCVWKSDLSQVLHTFYIGCHKSPQVTPQNSLSVNSSWITDAIFLPNLNKMLVAFDDRQLSFYDSVTADSRVHMLRMKAFEQVPLCLAYVPDTDNNLDRNILLFGDDGGYVNIITLPDKSSFNSLPRDVDPHALSDHGMPDFTYVRRKVHKDWVLGIKYFPTLKSYASCSSSSQRSLVIGDLESRSERVLNVYRGVNAFDLSRRPNFLVTGGFDHVVRLWNPYILSKPAALLTGHNATIVDVAVNDDGQVVSLSADKTVKVWDIRALTCIQTFTDKMLHRPDNTITVMHFDATNMRLITGSTVLDVWPMASSKRTESIKSHPNPLTAALYNVNFHQIVSGCVGSTITVWDLQSGLKAFRYQCGSGDTQELTAMRFDASGRRLITGARDGTLRVWNFNNGQCLKTLIKDDNAAVTDIEYVETTTNKLIFAAGWNRKICVFDDNLDATEVPCSRELPDQQWGLRTRGHSEDILSMAFCPPNLLATSSADGEIIVWNFESGFVKHRMRCPEYDSLSDDAKPIEKLIFLHARVRGRYNVPPLLSAGADGVLRFWSVRDGRHAWSMHAGHGENDTLTAVGADLQCRYLCTADNRGNVKLWDISELVLDVRATDRRKCLRLQITWRAHIQSIVSVTFIEERDLILTASVDCTIRLWTMFGEHMGICGQPNGWDLENLTICRRMMPQEVQKMLEDERKFAEEEEFSAAEGEGD
eukprot:Opistho-1_new@62676